jgi:chemotaxis protein methyltransferase CheR
LNATGPHSARAVDAAAVDFLRWALPRLGFRWEGFRNVRGQVDKRIRRRAADLGLGDLQAYRSHIETHPDELGALARACRVTISRLHRDRAVWDALRREVVPRRAEAALGRGEGVLRVWSAGCASGEEPLTMAILWHLELASRYPGLALSIVATDIDEEVLERARVGCYPASSVRECPPTWTDAAFRWEAGRACVREPLRAGIDLRCEDLRARAPHGPFDLVLCRNLAFTYFDEPLQREVAGRITERLVPGGVLVIGGHETLPAGTSGLAPVAGAPRGLYERNGSP